MIPGTGGGDVSFEVLNPDAKPAEQVVRAMDSDGAVLGYAAVGAAQGYSSRVRIMVGLGPGLEKIVGVKVVAQQETPGLGTRIAEVKSDKTIVGLVTGKGREPKAADPTPAFMKQFIGLKVDAVRLRSSGDGGRIQAISGATISSTAAVNATRNAIERIRRAASGDAPENESEGEDHALRQLVPGAGKREIRIEPVNPDAPAEKLVFRVVDGNGEASAYITYGQAMGYNDTIRIAVAMDADIKKLIGARVVSQQETPGYGTRIDAAASGASAGDPASDDTESNEPPDFMRQFVGLNLDEVQLRSEGGSGRVEAVSGATVSSAGAVKAVRDAMKRIRDVAGARQQ